MNNNILTPHVHVSPLNISLYRIKRYATSRWTHFKPTESSPTGSLLFFLLGSLVLKPSGNQS